MPTTDNLPPDELYLEGVQQFRRGEWPAAIATFTALQAAETSYPGVDHMLADARLKLQMESAEAPVPLPPPRGPLLRRVLLGAIVCLLLIGGGFLAMRFKGTPAPVAAVAQALPTRVAPTATPQPTAKPTIAAPAAPVVANAQVVSGTVVLAPGDGATIVNTPSNIEIIVDESGSMYSPVPQAANKPRFQVAKDALMNLLSSGTISPDALMALRTYGRQRGGDCGDLELAQPLKRFRGDAVAGVVQGLSPAVNGMTPLGASIRAAADDLKAAEGSTALIVITDGLEDCNVDPVAEAANFVKDSPGRKVHVIGFAIDDKAASDKLRAIAATGHGLYFDANDVAQLAAALRQTIEYKYQIVNEAGKEVASGIIGQGGPMQLAPGSYKLKINGNPPVEKDLVVDSGSHVDIRLRQGFGGLVVDVKSNTGQ